MSMPSGRLQFFVLEASDYLERLALIAGRPTPPDAGELIRLTRALRGAALMAGLQPFARAAAGLEQIAKVHRETPSTWTPARAETMAGAVERLRHLAAQAPDWTDADADTAAALAETLAAELETAGDGDQTPPRTVRHGDELPPSVRAFIGREGALIAGTLEDAAAALEHGRLERTADAVLTRLQPLRGLATLPSLSPLPEFLDAIELTVRSIRDETAPPSGSAALRRAAASVTQLARAVASGAEPAGDAPEVLLGAVSLLESFGRDDDVVDIAHLFVEGDDDPIVSPGTRPADDDGADSLLELVSLSDRLSQAAEQLAQPATATGRTLYLYGLLIQLRPLTAAAPRQRPHLAPLLRNIAAAIGEARASRDPLGFAEALREAAAAIGQAASARNAIFLGDELQPVAAMLQQVGAGTAAAVVDDESDVVPIESLAPDVIPVEELAPDGAPTEASAPEDVPAAELAAETAPAPAPAEPPASDVVPIEALAPDAAGAQVATDPDRVPSVFETSFSTYHRLLFPAPAAPEPVAQPASLPPDAGSGDPLAAVIVAPPADDERDVVAIDDLLFRGRKALERADQVRLELSDALKAQRPFTEIEPLVSELIDLVPLALAE